MANRYKNRNYKSAIQTYNGSNQPIVATDIISNPITVALGGAITDTGCAIKRDFDGFNIEYGGLYRISYDADITATTAGAVSIGLLINGVLVPETLKTNTVAAAGAEEVSAETVRVLNVCNAISDFNVQVIAYSDGTFVGAIDSISANVIKLA